MYDIMSMTLQEQWDTWGRDMTKSKQKRDSTNLIQLVDADLMERVDELCAIHKDETGFPLNRSAVFRRALEEFLDKEDV